MKRAANCETCAYYTYDSELDYYVCEVNLDEDEYSRFLRGGFTDCPYYNYYDEYKIVRKQN